MTIEEYREVGRGPDGKPLFRTRVLAFIAAMVGVHIKIGGWPYGTDNPNGIGVFHAKFGART